MDEIDRERRVQTICLLILTVVAIGATLWWLSAVMIPFVMAVFFAFALAPFIDLQVRYLRVPRALAVLATLVLGFVILNVLAGLVSASLSQLTANSAAYQAQIEKLATLTTTYLAKLGVEQASAFNPLSMLSARTIGSMLVGTTNALLGILSQSLMVMIFLFFILIGGTGNAAPVGSVWAEVEFRIKQYIVTKSVLSAATGALVGAVLSLLGIDLAMVFGLFAFLLNFIPSIGSIVATLLPVPMVLVSPDISNTAAFLALAVPSVIQLTIGNVIEPKVMGTSLDLHPVTILLSLILWGALWGIVGMLLATPITAVMKILFEKLELTAPLADLLAGRLDALRSR
jgi:AI-2 transport protein TqsA